MHISAISREVDDPRVSFCVREDRDMKRYVTKDPFETSAAISYFSAANRKARLDQSALKLLGAKEYEKKVGKVQLNHVIINCSCSDEFHNIRHVK